jgi:transposase
MKKYTHYIGIDVAATSLAASIFTAPDQPVLTKSDIANTSEGFLNLLQWLSDCKVNPLKTLVCMEATGVYCESLCYWFITKNFTLSVEPPLKIKRAFKLSEHKTDPVDSKQIAEYAYRFKDQLNLWKPKTDIVEEIKTLLTSRELFTKQLVANKNALKALEHKYVQMSLANNSHKKMIQHLDENIKFIDQQIKQLVDQDPTLKQNTQLIKSIPGAGMLLAANILVLTHGFTQTLSYKKLAAYIGICPYQYLSGSSVSKKSKSRRCGPSILRKLIHLAAASLRTHNLQFKKYFLRKVAEGKAKRLVLNNIANKLIKLVCAVLKTRTQFIENFQSVNPLFLKN